MRSFVLRIISLVVMIAALCSYQAVTVVHEKDDRIAQLQAQMGQTAAADGSAGQHWKDGIYQGEAQGFGGPVRSAVTVKKGKIVSVKILSHSGEDPAYYSQAEALLPKIVQKQSPDVDAVSGATYSSNGIKNAVRQALEKAK